MVFGGGHGRARSRGGSRTMVTAAAALRRRLAPLKIGAKCPSLEKESNFFAFWIVSKFLRFCGCLFNIFGRFWTVRTSGFCGKVRGKVLVPPIKPNLDSVKRIRIHIDSMSNPCRDVESTSNPSRIDIDATSIRRRFDVDSSIRR